MSDPTSLGGRIGRRWGRPVNPSTGPAVDGPKDGQHSPGSDWEEGGKVARTREQGWVRLRTLLPAVAGIATLALLQAVAPLGHHDATGLAASTPFIASDGPPDITLGDLPAATTLAADAAVDPLGTARGAGPASATRCPAVRRATRRRPLRQTVPSSSRRTPRPAPRRSQSSSSAAGSGVWAVMIGVNDYPGSSHDLQAAVADANDVDAALAQYQVPGNQRLLLRNGSATAGDILAAADWLVGNAGPNATAVFFYAGHVRQLGRGTEAVVGADGRVVPDSTLAEHLRPLLARQTWIGIAGCFGGGFTELLAPGRILTAAAPAGTYAYENQGFGRSYLVEYMVRRAMIQGYAPGSVQEAYAWAYQQLQRDYPNRMPVAYDQSGAPIKLGPSSPAKPTPPPPNQPPGGGTPPPSTVPPTTTTTPGCRGLIVIGHSCGG